MLKPSVVLDWSESPEQCHVLTNKKEKKYVGFSQLKCFVWTSPWKTWERKKNWNETFQNLIKWHRKLFWTKSKCLFSECSTSMFWLFWVFPPLIFFFPWLWKFNDTKPFLEERFWFGWIQVFQQHVLWENSLLLLFINKFDEFNQLHGWLGQRDPPLQEVDK